MRYTSALNNCYTFHHKSAENKYRGDFFFQVKLKISIELFYEMYQLMVECEQKKKVSHCYFVIKSSC